MPRLEWLTRLAGIISQESTLEYTKLIRLHHPLTFHPHAQSTYALELHLIIIEISACANVIQPWLRWHVGGPTNCMLGQSASTTICVSPKLVVQLMRIASSRTSMATTSTSRTNSPRSSTASTTRARSGRSLSDPHRLHAMILRSDTVVTMTVVYAELPDLAYTLTTKSPTVSRWSNRLRVAKRWEERIAVTTAKPIIMGTWATSSWFWASQFGQEINHPVQGFWVIESSPSWESSSSSGCMHQGKGCNLQGGWTCRP